MAETFAERLKRMREKRGMTVGQLALRADLTEAAIRKMEYGDTKGHGFVNGLKIAAALGVDPWELAFGKRPKHAHASDSPALEERIKTLQEQVVVLTEIAKAGLANLTEAQRRQMLARLEKLPEADRILN